MSGQKWSSLETYTILIVRPSPDGVLAAALRCRHHGTPALTLFVDEVRVEDVPVQMVANKRVVVVGATLTPDLAESLLRAGWELDVTADPEQELGLLTRLRAVANAIRGRYTIRSGDALCELTRGSVAAVAWRGLATTTDAVAQDVADPDKTQWDWQAVTAYLAQLIAWVGPRAVLTRLITAHDDASLREEANAYREERGDMVGNYTAQDIRDLLVASRNGYRISSPDLWAFFTTEADEVRNDIAQVGAEVLLDALDGFLMKKHGANWEGSGK